MKPPRPAQQDTSVPSPMWPVDYILNSTYSPLRMERQQPKRQWRDAFEDLLALESHNEMIDLKSRKQEKEMLVKIRHGLFSHMIDLINLNLRDLGRRKKQLWEAREKATLEGDTRRLSRLDDEILPELKQSVNKNLKVYKWVEKAAEAQQHAPASQLKTRGQWIASLISSGVLPGWSSRIMFSSRGSDHRTWMYRTADPRVQSDEKDRIAFTDNELKHHFGVTNVPTTNTTNKHPDEVTVNEHRYVGKSFAKAFPPGQDFITQITQSERVVLADGSTATKVVLTNRFRNGKEQRFEILQDAAKVLEEVERARLSIPGHQITW